MLLLAIAVANGETIYTADITGAFLYAPLLPGEILYMRPPKGYEDHAAFKGKVLRLIKSLYGARQAPRRWWEKLCTVLAKFGLKRTRIDPCLFMTTPELHVHELHLRSDQPHDYTSNVQ